MRIHRFIDIINIIKKIVFYCLFLVAGALLEKNFPKEFT